MSGPVIGMIQNLKPIHVELYSPHYNNMGRCVFEVHGGEDRFSCSERHSDVYFSGNCYQTTVLNSINQQSTGLFWE